LATRKVFLIDFLIELIIATEHYKTCKEDASGCVIVMLNNDNLIKISQTILIMLLST